MPLRKIIIIICRLSLKILMLVGGMGMGISVMYVHASIMSMSLISTTETQRSITTLVRSTINNKVLESVDHWKVLPTISKWYHIRSRKEQKLQGYQGRTRMAVAQWNLTTVAKWVLNHQSGQPKSTSQYSACPASKMLNSRNLIRFSLKT